MPPKLEPEPNLRASDTMNPPLLTNDEFVGKTNIMPPNTFHREAVDVLNGKPTRGLLPRETGEDIGFASPIPLSAEAVKIIVALRNMKDGDEDWGRWR